MSKVRIVIATIGLLGGIFLTPYIPLLAAAILALRFRAWEAMVLGLIVDMLWLPPGFMWGIPVATILAIVLVWGLEPLRKEFLN
jgi:hypothetical protein